MNDMMLAKMIATDTFVMDGASYESYDGKMEQVGEYMGDMNNSSNGSYIALWITIGVCIVLGITLGIILGRKSAMK